MIGLIGATASDVGQVREANEDRAYYSGTIAAVADGMGGHAAGEIASALAIAEVSGIRGPLSVRGFCRVVESANRRIYDSGLKPELRGMGTTIVAATLEADLNLVHLLNVGDSRGYLVRGSTISQVTVDHSLVEDLVRQGSIDREDALVHPQRNIVTRALGIAANVVVDTFAVEVKPGDRIILCSDGLSNEIDDAQIAKLAVASDDPAELAQTLVEAAVEAGGKDNVTVAVLIVTEDGEVPAVQNFMSLDDVEGDPESFGQHTEVDLHPIQITASNETVGVVVEQKAPRRRLSRVVLSVAVVAILATAYFTASWYATSAWFVDESAGEVVIYQGRPGGFLFWNPKVKTETGIASDDLDGASVERVNAKTVWASLAEAEAFVDNLDLANTDPTKPDTTKPDTTTSVTTGG